MKLFSLLIFIHSFSVSLDLQDVNRLKNWNLLQNNSVKIESRIYKGFPITKAETILEHNIEQIANIIKDLDNYPKIFERVTNTHRLGKNVVHIILVIKYDLIKLYNYFIKKYYLFYYIII